MVNCIGVPEHVLVTGVTVIKLVIGILDGFVEVNDGMEATPLVVDNPIAAFELVQLYMVLSIAEPVNVIPFISAPLHTI